MNHSGDDLVNMNIFTGSTQRIVLIEFYSPQTLYVPRGRWTHIRFLRDMQAILKHQLYTNFILSRQT